MRIQNNDTTRATSLNYIDIPSLTKSALLITDTILWCAENQFPIENFIFLFNRKNIISCSYSAHPVHQQNLRNLYLANSLATVVREPDIYRLLTFHVPNLMSLVYRLGLTKVSVKARGKCILS